MGGANPEPSFAAGVRNGADATRIAAQASAANGGMMIHGESNRRMNQEYHSR
jgi:hypothetical protein